MAACNSTQSGADTTSASKTTPAAIAAKEAVKTSVFPYEVQRATLDNGLRVRMIPMPAGGLVSYWSIVRTGSRDEVEEGFQRRRRASGTGWK